MGPGPDFQDLSGSPLSPRDHNKPARYPRKFKRDCQRGQIGRFPRLQMPVGCEPGT